jgi:hypothetical protein
MGWPRRRSSALPDPALTATAVYYAATGVWPLVHYPSFEWVAGPKRDVWLVKTFGGLLLPVAITLGYGAIRPRGRRASRLLGMSCAATLAVFEAWYVARRQISRVYLADAGVQLALLCAHWFSVGREAPAIEDTQSMEQHIERDQFGPI